MTRETQPPPIDTSTTVDLHRATLYTRDEYNHLKPTINYMTRSTQINLETQLNMARSQLETAQEIKGQAGEEFDWNDDFTFEQATRDVHLAASTVGHLEKALTNVEFLEPRQETDIVGIGNTIVVLFDGEENIESFTVLGPYDSAMHENWISFKSPLGTTLLGKSVGDVIQYSVNKKNIRVTITGILPGNFE